MGMADEQTHLFIWAMGASLLEQRGLRKAVAKV
jgi:hypothetical protein